MPIYQRCIICKKDFPLKSRKCRCKLTPELTPKLTPENVGNSQRFQYRIKYKRATKWRTKLLPFGITLKEAKNEEIRLLASDLEDSPSPAKGGHSGDNTEGTGTSEDAPLEVSFSRYYESAKLTKVTHKEDKRRWEKYIAGRDYNSSIGITAILGAMKDTGLSQQSIQLAYSLIRRVHNFHIENEIHPTGKNPCKSIKLPKVDNTLNDGLSKEEMAKLIHHLQNEETSNRPMALVVLLGVTTGRRQGEILKLRKDDVDLSRGMITCRDTKSGKTLTWPVNDVALEALKEAMEIAKSSKRETVFNYTGAGFRSNWERMKKRLIKKEVINKHIRFHSLRHTYASYLANEGVSLYVLQKLLGHSTIALTERYAALGDDTMREATGVIVNL